MGRKTEKGINIYAEKMEAIKGNFEGKGDMDMIRLIIPGPPLGKQRPRVLKTGKTYTPKETVNYETLVKELYATVYKMEKPKDGPLELQIQAYFAIPKSTSKVKRALMKSGKIRPTKKPDVDNIVKIVADALNGIAYKDDSQIVSCKLEKYYSEIPRVQVQIEEIVNS